ncbi:MAG: methionyl-tRNA formyltransferase [Desulfobulbaceae bacterium]|nr:methionyl-tRNA formyltransferase [Desulfobulbaceae bacterium]
MTSSPFRIVYMGTPDFAVPALEALLAHGEEVVAVVTQPDRPKGRGRKLAPPPVKEVALAAGIPVLQPKSIKTEEFLAEIGQYRPDLIVVVAFGRILPKPLIELPRLGTINVHGSLLPKYRGAAPIQWSLINNEAETGVTIMQMDEGLDTGDILLPGAIPIAADDTAATLAAKLSALGGKLLVEALERLKAGTLPPRKQDDAEATLAPILCKQEGVIDWQKPAAVISGLIRGLDPWPTASTILDGKQLRLFAPEVIAGQVSETPGTVCRADWEGLLIATGRDYLLVRELQLEGAKRLPVDAFLRGRPMAPGLQLG